MADDSKSVDLSGQNVDIDNLEVDIMIIAKIPNALKPTCAFLTRRGWPTFVQSNLGKAIEEIADRRPDIVMVSLNHPSPAILKLPDLIVQTFNLICVGFVEMTDTTSNSKLSARKIRYKVFGTPSGPNFHRVLRRILAEKFNIRLDEKRGQDEKSGEPKVRTLTPEKNVPGAVLGKSSASKTKKTDIGETTVLGLDGQEKDSPFGVRAEGLKFKASEVQVEDAATEEDVLSAVAAEGAKPREKAAGGEKKRVKLKELLGIEIPTDVSGNMVMGETIAGDEVKFGARAKMKGDKDEVDPSVVEMLKKTLFGDVAAAAEEEPPMAVMEKAVEKGIAKICQKDRNSKTVKITNVTRIGVLPVESIDNPGYIVIGLNANTQGFLKVCETSLQATFNSMGVFAKIQQGFWIDVPEIDFEFWAMSSAAFNFKLENMGHELAAAFFPTDKPLPKIQETADPGIVSIGLSEISTTEPVNFKAYIHLKTNDKYYLYLRNGRQLQPEQKQRLENRNISEVFLKSVDLENLRMFFASAHLKNTIKHAGMDEEELDAEADSSPGSGSDDEAA